MVPFRLESSNELTMSNETDLAEIDRPCDTAKCPPDKICVEDSFSEKGYKCCQNRKKCVIRCKDPETSPNSTRVPDVRDPPKFRPGERIVFTCKHGFMTTKSNGNSPLHQLRCLDDGRWSREKPRCFEIGDPRLYSNYTASAPTSTAAAHPANAGIIALSFLSCVSIIALLVFLYLYFTRYRNRSYCDIPLYCRRPSRQVPLENTHLSMPENLEDNAVMIQEFGQFVALRHNNDDELFHSEFEAIQRQPATGLSCEASLMDENQDKNRYTNISAYDHSRVRLGRSRRRRHHSGYSDYINANYVSSYENPKAYIACQGPLPETFGHFWQMVWENNVSVIVMITNLVEKGRKKCDQYWPQDGREQYNNFAVSLRDEDVYANYTVRTLQLRDQKQSKRRSYNSERRVLQFHYTQWPDHGTPEYILPLLTFIRRSTQSSTDSSAPIVVHCSAGVGRTGAYIVLDSMIRMARCTGKVNINEFLKFIRTQRNHLVQTVDQYTFLFDALLDHFISGNTECPGQRLKDYVSDLTKTATLKPAGNGVKSSDSNEARKVVVRSGMENQFLIVARQVVRNIDYDFAKRKVNENKNRTNGVLPIFRSRVPLNYRIGSEGSDYINASYLQGYRNGRAFIITQLPMMNTRKDFWSLVWDHNCSVIITIRDKKWNEKEDEYWPTEVNQVSCPLCNVSLGSRSQDTKTFGKFNVTCRGFVLEATKDDYVLSTTQLDINFWPTLDELDSDFTQLLNFVDKTLENKDSSVIIQDRYGSTAAAQLACAHHLHQQLANENAVDVFQTVRVAHQMRPGIFRTHKDLHFLYKAMLLETHRTSRHQNGIHPPISNRPAPPETSSDTTPLLDIQETKPQENSKISEDDAALVTCDVTNTDDQTGVTQFDIVNEIADDNSNSEKNSVATKESDVTITNSDDHDNSEVFEESASSATTLLV